jgi:hypothetical protein
MGSFASAEAGWLDDGGGCPEGYVTEERTEEIAIQVAAIMREMLARFVACESPTIAESIRANWIPSWGKDPGKWEGEIPKSVWDV